MTLVARRRPDGCLDPLSPLQGSRHCSAIVGCNFAESTVAVTGGLTMVFRGSRTGPRPSIIRGECEHAGVEGHARGTPNVFSRPDSRWTRRLR